MPKTADSHPANSDIASPAGGRGRFVLLLIGFFSLLLLMQMPSPGASQEFVSVNPYRIEAAFLRNFARYVTWPEQAFTDQNSPWRIGILGKDPFGDVLEATFEGRTEQGRSFEIYRADTLDDLPPCQIIFVVYADPGRRRAALAKLQDKPVLTVSEAQDFLQEGGIIRFQLRETVQMGVNLDQARSVSLKIQTKMLEVSREVVENGTVRRRK